VGEVDAVVVKSAKRGNAAEIDRSTSELLHVGGAAMIILLVTIFSTVWADLSVSSRWGHSQIVVLRKGTKRFLRASN